MLKQIVSNAEKKKLSDCLVEEGTQRWLRNLQHLFLSMLELRLIASFQKKFNYALPSLRTIQQTIHSEYKTLNEGEFRFDDLVTHLSQHKAPNVIHLVTMQHVLLQGYNMTVKLIILSVLCFP